MRCWETASCKHAKLPQKGGEVHTRTLTWLALRLSPTTSCGISVGSHHLLLASDGPPPGIGGICTTPEASQYRMLIIARTRSQPPEEPFCKLLNTERSCYDRQGVTQIYSPAPWCRSQILPDGRQTERLDLCSTESCSLLSG